MTASSVCTTGTAGTTTGTCATGAGTAGTRGAAGTTTCTGGATGTTTGAEDHDAEVAEVEGEDLTDGADEAGSVGVETGGAGTVEEEGVDRTELAGGVVEFGAEFEGGEFVGYGEVESEEVGATGTIDGFGEVLRRALHLGVAEVGAEGFEGRVVHGGGKRVLDGGAEDGEADFGREGAAAFGAGAEVVEGESGLLEVGHWGEIKPRTGRMGRGEG